MIEKNNGPKATTTDVLVPSMREIPIDPVMKLRAHTNLEQHQKGIEYSYVDERPEYLFMGLRIIEKPHRQEVWNELEDRLDRHRADTGDAEARPHVVTIDQRFAVGEDRADRRQKDDKKKAPEKRLKDRVLLHHGSLFGLQPM